MAARAAAAMMVIGIAALRIVCTNDASRQNWPFRESIVVMLREILQNEQPCNRPTLCLNVWHENREDYRPAGRPVSRESRPLVSTQRLRPCGHARPAYEREGAERVATQH